MAKQIIIGKTKIKNKRTREFKMNKISKRTSKNITVPPVLWCNNFRLKFYRGKKARVSVQLVCYTGTHTFSNIDQKCITTFNYIIVLHAEHIQSYPLK